MDHKTEVLIVAALPLEFDAARAAFSKWSPDGEGVSEWRDVNNDVSIATGHFQRKDGDPFQVTIGRPTRMGGVPAATLAAQLVERFRPDCLAMCGVCAGNPGSVSLGDVVMSELTYIYDEGKRTKSGVEFDHRQSTICDDWLTVAQIATPAGLPTFGEASSADSEMWLLHRLYRKQDPVKSPSRRNYFPEGRWQTVLQDMEANGFIERVGSTLAITDLGRDRVDQDLLYNVDPPKTLPYSVQVGPIASGSVVVKDGVTWDQLKVAGVRTAIGLEMEGGAIGWVARQAKIEQWIVVKGVMDYADPEKDDRYKPFAAKASAEVLASFLSRNFKLSTGRHRVQSAPSLKTGNSVTITGDGNQVVQNLKG